MARNGYLPARDEDLSAWAVNFSALITATPTAFGLIAADATALAALVTAYTTALAAAVSAATRGRVTVATKNVARTALITDIRALAKRIQATASVTATQKTSLGLSIRDTRPSSVPAPATVPLLNLMEVDPLAHKIRLADETSPTRRARPDGAAGAEIFAFIPSTPGATPPADLENWEFKGLATRTTFAVQYNAQDAGKQATIVARWFNRKGETGPASTPITGTVAA